MWRETTKDTKEHLSVAAFVSLSNSGLVCFYAPAITGSTSYIGNQDVAAFSLSLTLLMFFTPSVSSHLRNASAPCFAYTGIPSFQVARPQRTPLNFTPVSPASSNVSLNSALLTPAER